MGCHFKSFANELFADFCMFGYFYMSVYKIFTYPCIIYFPMQNVRLLDNQLITDFGLKWGEEF